MEKETTLNQINSETNINQAISRDEEMEMSDLPPALQWAEDLILELPESHEGRNRWLAKYGQSSSAIALKNKS